MTDMSMAPQDDNESDEGAEICVKIELDTKTGEVTVGVEPPGYKEAEGSAADEQAEESFMKPAKSVDDALSIAKDLLTNPNVKGAQDGQAFEQGYQSIRGGPPMAGGSQQ